MDLRAMLPKELRRGSHMICRIAPRAGFVACGFIHHRTGRRAPAEPVRSAGLYGLSIAIAGTAIYRDRHGERHPLRPGTIFQFSDPAGGATGRVESQPGFFECTVSFSERIGAKLEELGLWKSSFLRASAEPAAALVQRYLDLYVRMEASPISYEQALRGIIPIVDAVYAHAASVSASERLIEEACRLLGEQGGARLSAQRIAKELGLPYETFRKLFTRQVGVAPHAYRLRQRMQQACGLLGESSVKEVAARLGYRTPFAFSRQFSKVMGVPPKTFKR
jgi:AraC-like DNA-binding protein